MSTIAELRRAAMLVASTTSSPCGPMKPCITRENENQVPSFSKETTVPEEGYFIDMGKEYRYRADFETTM